MVYRPNLNRNSCISCETIAAMPSRWGWRSPNWVRSHTPLDLGAVICASLSVRDPTLQHLGNISHLPHENKHDRASRCYGMESTAAGPLRSQCSSAQEAGLTPQSFIRVFRAKKHVPYIAWGQKTQGRLRGWGSRESHKIIYVRIVPLHFKCFSGLPTGLT